jgi:hypothetical protein
MSTEPPVNFYEASLPIYWFFRLFGLAPFSFQGPVKNGNLVVTPLDKIIFFFILSFHSLAIYIFIRYTTIIVESQDTGFLSISWQICFLFIIFSKMFVVIYSYCRQQDFINFIETLGSFYKMVSETISHLSFISNFFNLI